MRKKIILITTTLLAVITVCAILTGCSVFGNKVRGFVDKISESDSITITTTEAFEEGNSSKYSYTLKANKEMIYYATESEESYDSYTSKRKEEVFIEDAGDKYIGYMHNYYYYKDEGSEPEERDEWAKSEILKSDLEEDSSISSMIILLNPEYRLYLLNDMTNLSDIYMLAEKTDNGSYIYYHDISDKDASDYIDITFDKSSMIIKDYYRYTEGTKGENDYKITTELNSTTTISLDKVDITIPEEGKNAPTIEA